MRVLTCRRMSILKAVFYPILEDNDRAGLVVLEPPRCAIGLASELEIGRTEGA